MTADEKMSKAERRQYLQRMQKRYKRANRSEKTTMLDEMLILAGCRRSHLPVSETWFSVIYAGNVTAKWSLFELENQVSRLFRQAPSYLTV